MCVFDAETSVSFAAKLPTNWQIIDALDRQESA
jgi:hypothetical protein